jgi:hypothetical protein
MSILLQISLSIATPIVVMFITTMAISYEDFPYYKKTYNFLYKGEYISIRDWGGQITFIGNSRKECIGFEDKSIKLINDGYIHSSSPVTLFNPYALYYKRKINKLIKQIRAMEPREDEQFNENTERYRSYAMRSIYREMRETGIRNQEALSERLGWHTTRIIETEQKPKEFKFFSENKKG